MGSELDRIIRDLSQGIFITTRHAEKRMKERRVRFEDIRCCAQTVRNTRDQGDGKYLIIGDDFEGDELKIVAAWDGETVIITVIGD